MSIATITPKSEKATCRPGEFVEHVFGVFNPADRPIRVSVETLGELSDRNWVSVLGELELDLPGKGQQDVKVRIGVPADATPATADFQLRVYDVNDTERVALSPRIAVVVPAPDAPPPKPEPKPGEAKPFPWWIVAVIGGAVVLLGVIGLVIFFAVRSPAEVPDLVGLPFDEAVAVLEGEKLTLGDVSKQPSADDPPDTVLQQAPKAGGPVPDDKTVKLVVSTAVESDPEPGPATRVNLRWTRLPGAAHDIGVGADGSAWVIGTNTEGGGFGIYRLAGNTWTKIAGSAVRIDVDNKGNGWVVNNKGNIYRHDGNRWIQLPGAAKDIGVGANGTVWVIGTNVEGGGFGIYRWAGQQWTKIPGSALKIDVDSKGNAWVVNNKGNIYRFNGSSWTQMPGGAVDIGIGADDSVWVLGRGRVGGGYNIFKWDGQNWLPAPGGLTSITVDPKGLPWGTNSSQGIFRSSL